MSKIIVIASGKGGVGKTTTAINLGAALHYFGKDVLIVDGNLSTPNVGIHLNSPDVPINLNHVLQEKADVCEAVYEHESGLKIIPSSLSIKELKKTNPKKLKNLLEDLKKLSEYIIIDSAAGLGLESTSAMEMADELIIVTNPEMPAITDALKTIKFAEQMKKSVKGIIMTRVRKDKIEMHPETVKDMLETQILGMIPENLDVKRALNKKETIIYAYPKSKVSRAYKEIAARILEIEYNSKKDRLSLWERIFKRKD